MSPGPPSYKRPHISVVMAVRDGGDAIEEQLGALAGQTLDQPWELVVVDNGSTDGTPDRVLAWEDRLPQLRLVHGPIEPSRSRPLNVGAAAARAELLTFCDSDDVVGAGWLEAMVRALGEHPHVTGPIRVDRLSPSWIAWSEEARRRQTAPAGGEYLPYAVGCNAGWQRRAFEAIRGFDEVFRSGQDTDISWRAQLAGFELWFEPGAVVDKRSPSTLRGTFRQHFRFGRSTARLAVRYRPYGMPAPSMSRAVFAWGDLVVHLWWLLGRAHRRQWVALAGFHSSCYLPVRRGGRAGLRLDGDAFASTIGAEGRARLGGTTLTR